MCMKNSYPLESELVVYNDGKDIHEVLKDISALSNNIGGTIYCGMNEKGKIIGINPTFFLEQLIFHVKSYLNPPLIIENETVLSGHKYLVLLKVENAKRMVSVKIKDEQSSYYRLAANSLKTSKILQSLINLEKGIFVPKLDVNEISVSKIMKLIAKSSGLTLSQIYQQSHLPKQKIDILLPILLYRNQISVCWANDKFEFIS